METLRKHSGVVVLCLLVAWGFYQLGENRGQASIPAAVTELTGTAEGKPEGVDFSAFWKAWNLLNEKFIAASTTAKEVTEQDKVYGAIEGLTESLGDPYTVFFPPVESEMFASDVRGNFDGVGMEVLAQNGSITVIAPLKGSPAEAAGIQAGDKIVRINGEVTSGMTTEDAVTKIRGPKGTKVALTIARAGAKGPIEVSVERATINIPVINTKKLENGIFVIELYSFSANSPTLFRQALREFVESKSDKLIIDLRGNPGGYLEAAIDMASWFLPSNKVVVKESFGGDQEDRIYRSRGYDIFNDNLKLAIITDKGSASASEILAGALKENGKAVIVGDTTFGKGSVQELIDLTDTTSIKITIARWLTPNGNSISDKGITPDYPVTYTLEDKTANRDPQLQKAIQVLTQ